MRAQTSRPRSMPAALRNDSVPVDARAHAEAHLRAGGIHPAIVSALVSDDVCARAPFGTHTLSPAEVTTAVDAAFSALRLGAHPAPSVDALTRAAAVAACALALTAGNGITRASNALGQAIGAHLRGDAGSYACDESRHLVEAASLVASRGHTHGHDCFFQSVGSILGRKAEDVGEALGLHTSGYHTDGGDDVWAVGPHLTQLGATFVRFGKPFTDVFAGEPRVHLDTIGFFARGATPGDAWAQAQRAMKAAAPGARFLLKIGGHYAHAWLSPRGLLVLDSQTLSGRTLVVPASALAAATASVDAIHVTEVRPRAGSSVAAPKPVTLAAAAFLRDCPFAWEESARA